MFAAKNTAAPSGEAVYIESVFSTYLYTGNGSTQTITNGIDLAGKGGLVWTKSRTASYGHYLTDSAIGIGQYLRTETTNAQQASANRITSLNSNGYTLGDNAATNASSEPYASWTFRKQAKFFDVVTYTGDSIRSAIPHNLGSVPGCIIVKRTSTGGTNWQVYHRGAAKSGFTAAQSRMSLNTTDAVTDDDIWTNTAPTSTEFYVKLGNTTVNANAETYVAYLFAHDAGGFGASGSDNVISCGSFTTNGSGNATVTLGYEPQLVIWKAASGSTPTGNWWIADNMRGFSQTGMNTLYANTSAAENVFTTKYVCPTATGFELVNGFENPTTTYIYIAIRRGPMKTPTSGTSVFYPLAVPQAASLDTSTVPFPPDLVNTFSRNGTARTSTYLLFQMLDRLRGLGVPSTSYVGGSTQLVSSSTAAEDSSTNAAYVSLLANSQDITRGTGWGNALYGDWVNYFWRRAPGFFDVVCYTGTGANRTVTHNLTVAPELMIVKNRSNAENWGVYSATIGNTKRLRLNATDAETTAATEWNNTSPTSSVFTVGTDQEVNFSGNTYVAYLFASCPGVSKVGSYTGNGSSQTINCGFTAGARFVMIKRTDSTGDWYVWDTARGIVSGNDPRLSLNSTAAEVTTDDSIDPDNSGFIVNQLSATNINVSSASYIFLAIS